MNSPGTVIFCQCRGRSFVSDQDRAAIAAALHRISARKIIIPDLCGLVVKDPQFVRSALAGADSVAVIACHPRAINALLNLACQAQSTPGQHQPAKPAITTLNLRQNGAAGILPLLATWSQHASATTEPAAAPELNGDWDPWFPVIDRTRCKNCKQCMSFCLFGVYESGPNGTVDVTRPSNCKNNCPACARICPEAAIIFPKCNESPINGAEITDETELRRNIKVNVDTMLGDDVYAALAERRKRAQTQLLKDNARNQAETERKQFAAQQSRQEQN